MRVLTLSDLNWNEESKKLTKYLVRNYDHSNPKDSNKYFSYLFYRAIIDETNPDLVLLAGDITGDGSCGHGFHFSLSLLLQYLELQKVTTLFIRGNHDIPKSFDYIIKMSKKLKYIKYIGGQIRTFRGLSVLGLDFQDTENKTKLKEYLAQVGNIDIVLSHCQLARRPWLFDFNTEYIITGHYQNHLCQIGGKVFISLENDIPEDFNYITIDFDIGKHSISYYNYNQLESEVLIQKAIKRDASFQYTYTPPKLERVKKGDNIFSTPYYRDTMNLILKTKTLGYPRISEKERKYLEEVFYIHGKNLLMDYLGTTILDKNRWGLRKIKVLPKELKDQIQNMPPTKKNYYRLGPE